MPTTITALLTNKIIKPFRSRVPELSYFSVDFGKSGSEFAQPVKFGQEVISALIAAPAAEAFTPGDSLATNTQNPKDLISDVAVRIDQAAKVSIKLPVADAVRYVLDPAFKETLEEAGIQLGRYVVAKAVAKFTQANFSQEKVATVAAVEFETLGSTRVKMNKLGSRAPRFIIGESEWVNKLSEDPVIAGGDYHGQLVQGDPYLTLQNIQGFNAIREFPNMPTNTVLVGAATVANVGDLLTLNAHGLANGQRIRLTGTLPAGLALNTDYYVIAATTNTFQVSATFGGAAVVITADGNATVSKYEGINAVAFERRAIHIAFRPLLDNSDLARELGIPETSKKMMTVDPETGVAITWHFWENASGTAPTGDVYATAVIAFGIVAGREIKSATAPASEAAGSGMDYGAVRLVESAAT